MRITCTLVPAYEPGVYTRAKNASFDPFYEVSVVLWITPYATSFYSIYLSTTPASRTLLEFDVTS